MGDLRFNGEKYEVKTCELDGKTITYRAFEGIEYCEKPVDEIQKLNIFVPEEFYEKGEVNGYTLKTVPIFMPNSVGGYMAGPASEPGKNFLGIINAEFEALRHGYVVVCAGIRGRNSGMATNEFFVGGKAGNDTKKEGRLVGRAPALIVDMKAAIRYLRHNRDVIPGDVEKIITSGTSAGGALSALTGATGNCEDYEPFLKAIGAADERDDIFAANCYCPIHNLDNADTAYEWLFNKEHIAHMMKFEEIDGQVKMSPTETHMTEEEIKVSNELKAMFPQYLNSLNLKDDNGNPLTLDEEGNGSFKDYVLSFVAKSAEKELKDHESLTRHPAFLVRGSEVEKQDCLTVENDKVTAIDFEKFVSTITRMKNAPAFDALNLKSPENEEFGTEEVFARHFTKYSADHSIANGDMADEQLIKMLNPTKYVGCEGTAKHWRIRHGAFDRDTSLAIPVILATMLKNKGYDVDFFLPWGLPHSGDYDLPELFAWIDSLAKSE